MKILALSDIHTRFNRYPVEAIAAQKADLIVVAGDIGEVNGEAPLAWLLKLGEICETIAIPGNHDVWWRDWEGDEYPHPDFIPGSRVTVLCASLSPAFDVPLMAWRWVRMTADPARDLDYWANAPERAVVVSHCPPFGTLDETVPGRHIGSQGLAAYIERVRPWLVICGHVHECGGQTERVGDTVVVNCAEQPMLTEMSAAGGCYVTKCTLVREREEERR